MYGTDFPFRGCVENVEGLKAYGFERRAIFARSNGTTPLRIMPQLAR